MYFAALAHAMVPVWSACKCQYRDKVESQFNGSNTIRMWQGLQTIKDYKKKTSPVADINVLLPDKLNNFFARFWTIQCHRWPRRHP